MAFTKWNKSRKFQLKALSKSQVRVYYILYSVISYKIARKHVILQQKKQQDTASWAYLTFKKSQKNHAKCFYVQTR